MENEAEYINIPIIVDACVAIKWFFAEDYNEKAYSLLQNCFMIGVPYFFLLEFSNFLLRKRRKEEISQSISDETNRILLEYIDCFYPDNHLIVRAIRLSNEINHSPYDCLYLACSEHYNIPLITADHDFYKHVKKSAYARLIYWMEEPPMP
ncbi:MAG: PIN domain-containing protein [Candidatus Omnitrophota bacterium]|jgi:predicted nucleic acid-binding protein|nr:MAG: PIN domain-containing protein [Candidatus Omnitrophota bacterium]